MALALVTAPTIEPVTLADAKVHLGVHGDDQDTYIDSLVVAARGWCESFLRQSLLTTTWRQTLDGWPTDGIIELSKPPLQSVTSVQYVDTDGATQTLATSQYAVDTYSKPGMILRGYGITWPTLRTSGVAAPVTVVFIAGHTTTASVPQTIKHAIKLMVGHWYENREIVVTGTIATKIPDTARALLSAASHGAYP